MWYLLWSYFKSYIYCRKLLSLLGLKNFLRQTIKSILGTVFFTVISGGALRLYYLLKYVFCHIYLTTSTLQCRGFKSVNDWEKYRSFKKYILSFSEQQCSLPPRKYNYFFYPNHNLSSDNILLSASCKSLRSLDNLYRVSVLL